MTFSRDAAKVMLELTEWFAHEKMIDATNAYEAGDKDAYREMTRIEAMIEILKEEQKRI